MNIRDLVRAMEAIAPTRLAEPWDNVGLLAGDASRPLTGPVMLCIDFNPAVLAEARAQRAGAIVAYHPPIFAPLKRLTASSAQGAALLGAIEAGIAIYAPHTALDSAPGRLSDWLLDAALGAPAHDRAPITPHVAPAGAHKVVTFVPAEAQDRVRDAMAAAGAGVIGNYDHCAFAAPGEGTFCGNERSDPAVGRAGALERVAEVRLEMLCPGDALARTIQALRAAHPYEEPPIDVYALAGVPTPGAGAGRIGSPAGPLTLAQIATNLKRALAVPHVLVAAGARTNADVASRVAVVPGSGGELASAALDLGADVFVTGEMKHHEVLALVSRGCSVILAGHTETERPYLPVLAGEIRRELPGVSVVVSTADRAPAVAM